MEAINITNQVSLMMTKFMCRKRKQKIKIKKKVHEKGVKFWNGVGGGW
jgi:hypothetical protein